MNAKFFLVSRPVLLVFLAAHIDGEKQGVELADLLLFAFSPHQILSSDPDTTQA